MTAATIDGIALRLMEDKDLPLSFYNYVTTRLDEMRQSGWQDEAIQHFLYAQAQTQHQYYMQHYQQTNYFIIIYQEQDVGRLYVDDVGPEIRIVDIALLPEYRNLGIGTALIHKLQAQGKQQQRNVSIHVEQHNPALSLYQRLGFKFVREVNGIYHLMHWDCCQPLIAQGA
jgi:ribosomal protein S18 acetylase RimI-like enzyme